MSKLAESLMTSRMLIEPLSVRELERPAVDAEGDVTGRRREARELHVAVHREEEAGLDDMAVEHRLVLIRRVQLEGAGHVELQAERLPEVRVQGRAQAEREAVGVDVEAAVDVDTAERAERQVRVERRGDPEAAGELQHEHEGAVEVDDRDVGRSLEDEPDVEVLVRVARADLLVLEHDAVRVEDEVAVGVELEGLDRYRARERVDLEDDLGIGVELDARNRAAELECERCAPDDAHLVVRAVVAEEDEVDRP
jgi:hypothetical protein